MKKTLFTAILAVSASAMMAQNDSIQVCMDFNANPWNLAVAQMSSTSWSKVDVENSPAAAFLDEGYDFTASIITGKDIVMSISASDYLQTTYDNCLANTYDYDNEANGITPRPNVLFLYTGTTMTFKAPEGYRFAKVVFDTFRSWASGGIGSCNNTWTPELDKTYNQLDDKGNITWSIESWHGNNTEWGTPACTGSTRLRKINFWMLPTTNAIETIESLEQTTRSFDLNGRLSKGQGIQIMNNRKYVIE